MRELLSAAGRSFLRAFAAALVVLAPGVLAAPNLNGALVLATAGILAAFAAGLRAIQGYVPQLSIGHYIGTPWGTYADSFLRAFLAALLTLLPGAFSAPDLATGKSLAVAAIVGAFTAGFRALQGLLTNGEGPVANTGIAPPPKAHELT